MCRGTRTVGHHGDVGVHDRQSCHVHQLLLRLLLHLHACVTLKHSKQLRYHHFRYNSVVGRGGGGLPFVHMKMGARGRLEAFVVSLLVIGGGQGTMRYLSRGPLADQQRGSTGGTSSRTRPGSPLHLER
jgi:hypothetical protein